MEADEKFTNNQVGRPHDIGATISTSDFRET